MRVDCVFHVCRIHFQPGREGYPIVRSATVDPPALSTFNWREKVGGAVLGLEMWQGVEVTIGLVDKSRLGKYQFIEPRGAIILYEKGAIGRGRGTDSVFSYTSSSLWPTSTNLKVFQSRFSPDKVRCTGPPSVLARTGKKCRMCLVSSSPRFGFTAPPEYETHSSRLSASNAGGWSTMASRTAGGMNAAVQFPIWSKAVTLAGVRRVPG